MKKFNSKNKSRKGKSRNGSGRSVSHPPQIDGTELRHSVTMRFITRGAINQSITFQNLLDTFLVATSAVAGSNVFQTVRVRSVKVWALPALGAASSVVVEFAGITAGVIGDQAYHSDTSMGIQPAHVVARPAARSLAADYQLNSAAIAFNLTCPTGSVVDVDLTFRGTFGTAVAEANALVGATAGAFYLRGLDGLATAGSLFSTEVGPQL